MTLASAPAYLMKGATAHTRFAPHNHAFRYNVTLIDIDVDRLDAANTQSRLFNITGKFPFSLDQKTRGDLGQTSLADWARSLFSEARLDAENCEIRLITFPKTFGFSFSPLSVWLGLKDGIPVGVIYEVNNTFGERYSYVARLDTPADTHTAAKVFHVSPFMDTEGEYRFQLSFDGTAFNLLIQNVVGQTLMHSASLSLSRAPLSTKSALSHLIRAPFAAFGVWTAIHWEAAKLFMKKLNYHPKPPVLRKLFSIARRPESVSSSPESAK